MRFTACGRLARSFSLVAALVAGSAGIASADIQVFDNGPFITGIGTGTGGTNLSVTEATAGIAVSFSASLAIPARAVDDFVISGAPAAGTRLANMHFYGTQSNAPTTAHFGAVYVTIYDGSPAAGGTPIAGNFTTNRLVSTSWTGAYRVSSGLTTSTSRPIFDLNIDMSWVPPLPNGQYYMAVSAVGDLSVSPTANPNFFFVTPHAQGNGGLGGPDNAFQFFNNNYVPVYEVPFKLSAFCPADYNKSHGLEIQDIFDYLNAWFAGNPDADFNGGGLAVQDIFDFLNAWFAGC